MSRYQEKQNSGAERKKSPTAIRKLQSQEAEDQGTVPDGSWLESLPFC